LTRKLSVSSGVLSCAVIADTIAEEHTPMND
jgi:hypothetical protein